MSKTCVDHLEKEGYRIVATSDAYRALFDKLLRDEIPKKPLLVDSEKNFVYLVEIDGKRFVFKRVNEEKCKLDSRLWYFFTGPFYSRLMRTVHRALENGCTVIPDMYVVAEKISFRRATDTYLLTEYLDGTILPESDQARPYHGKIVDAFHELHKYGLSLGNVKGGNLVYDEQRDQVRMIDLSNRGIQSIGRAKDAYKLHKIWGISLPPRTLADRTARLLVAMQFGLRTLRKKCLRLVGK